LVTSAEENQSEFLLLQVHVIPTISEKPTAFVELKSVAMSKKRPCFRWVIGAEGSTDSRFLHNRTNASYLSQPVVISRCTFAIFALSRFQRKKWRIFPCENEAWLGAESNRRHEDFQSAYR